MRPPLIDCYQWQTQIAHSTEQAVQRGLVYDEGLDDGGAVGLVGDTDGVEPGGPSGIQVPLEADLEAPSFVHWHAPKVGSDVVRWPHHMW
jgi:hypothetical protein